jgi:hypothetical protein
MNQYRCETCTNLKCIWNHENPHAYSGIFPKRKKTLAAAWANNFMVKVGCASHSDFQSERDTVLDELQRWGMGYYGYEVNVATLQAKIKELRQQAGEP